MRILGRLLAYARRHTVPLAAAFLLAMLGAAVELARPWPVKLIVDYGLTPAPWPPTLTAIAAWLPGAASPQGLVAWSVGAAVMIVLAGAGLSFMVLALIVRICQRMVYEISLDLFDRVQRLSLTYHAQHAVGDLLQRLSADVFVIHFAVSQVALPGAISLLTLVGMFFVMAQINVTLSLIALAVVPLLAGALAVFLSPMERTTGHQYAVQGAVMTLIEQSLTAVRAIQGFAREDHVKALVAERERELSEAYGSATRVSAAYKEATTAITGIAAAVILWFGAARVVAGQMSVGDLWVFLGYLAALYGPVSILSMAVGYAVQVVSRGRRVFEVMDSREMVAECPDAVPLETAQAAVEFQDVSFGYSQSDQDRPGVEVLHRASFRAEPGQIIALVGPTGAGKTSLVSLIPRFYDPCSGRILINGRDLRSFTLRSVREHVSLVLQDPYLFAMSVADNIAFGRPGASPAEIRDAARLARAHDFIERLPDGYGTVIGEKGTTLSGGERQRISIARALIKNAPILILDEPTSALDADTESLIFEAMAAAMRNRTVFIISHRLTTVMRADRILAVDDGRIVESGTHDNLMKQGGLYARLYRLQHLAALQARSD